MSTKDWTVWIIGHCALVWCTWAGFIGGVEGARNAVLFYAWAVALPMSLLAALSVEVHKRLAAKPPPSAPQRFVNRAIQCGVLGVLVWQGFAGTAVAWCLAMLLVTVASEAEKKLRRESAA